MAEILSSAFQISFKCQSCWNNDFPGALSLLPTGVKRSSMNNIFIILVQICDFASRSEADAIGSLTVYLSLMSEDVDSVGYHSFKERTVDYG